LTPLVRGPTVGHPSASKERVMRRTARFGPVALLGLVLAVGPQANAAFPGENGLIVFNHFTRGQVDLWTIDPVTGDRTRLTDTPRKDEALADWNAAGTQIAFTRCGLGKFSNCDIWVMDADGSNRTRLTTTPTFQETWPVWSPDGSKIAFTTNATDLRQDIWVMDPDGTDPVQLTFTNGVFDAFPEWSPDGSKIAFISDREAGHHIWVMDPDGSDPVRLTSGNAVHERPDWSPDGSTITFSRFGRNIFSMNADGSDVMRLTDSPRIETAPAYSPDGAMITFNRRDANGRFGVWVMSADGSAPTKLTSGRFDFFPDWQPV
jgi:Tol biopolymer transport system component